MIDSRRTHDASRGCRQGRDVSKKWCLGWRPLPGGAGLRRLSPHALASDEWATGDGCACSKGPEVDKSPRP